MNKILAVINKELLVLVRDIPALLVLFIMPILLIIVVSVAEEKVSNQSKITILLIAHDTTEIKRDIEKGLQKSDYFVLKNIAAADSQAVTSAKFDIAMGKYQVGIIVPAGITQLVATRAEKFVTIAATTPDALDDSLESKNTRASITVIFDPAIKESIKNSVTGALEGIFVGTEIKALVKKYFARLESDIKTQFRAKMDSLKQKDVSVDIPDFPLKDEINRQVRKKIGQLTSEEIYLKIPDFPWRPQSMLTLIEEFAESGDNAIIKPTVSQTRVPGFTLFAMFFIVIPLAGSIVTERHEGAFNRLRTLPVSYLTLISGKIIVYTAVCMLQFFFMMIIGLYILPAFFDMPALVIGSHYTAIIITALMSSFAAIGFGLLVGTWSSSHAQAGTLGSVMAVILGILGGVFIPTYLMPSVIKIISTLSPLRWGIDSFIDLFVRNTGFVSIFSNIIKLFLFFILSLAISLYSYSRRN